MSRTEVEVELKAGDRVYVIQVCTRTVHHRSSTVLHCKKELAIFPSPAGMSLTKLSLGGISDIPAGDGKTAHSFLQCSSAGKVHVNGRGDKFSRRGSGGGGGRVFFFCRISEHFKNSYSEIDFFEHSVLRQDSCFIHVGKRKIAGCIAKTVLKHWVSNLKYSNNAIFFLLIM
jgi:hypothetical protein